MSHRILIVDDEPDLLELTRVNLSGAGLVVDTAESGTEAFEKLRRSPPDLLILDLLLPDLSGTEICRRVRSDPRLSAMPIIMLTARSEEIDRVVGFELGADDYVTKPFSPRELVLRVQAVLRRRDREDATASTLEQGVLRLDPESHRCWVDGEEVTLTAKEFDLLHALMSRRGRAMTRDALIDAVWGHNISVTSRTIDTHLKRLREKLGAAGDMIETVRGVGYRFQD
jgi:two-component system phosphate regulon response regulator PhoB